MKLDKLLEFSDTIPALLAAQKMPEQTCQTCSRKGTDLKCCGRCRLFWYCNAVSSRRTLTLTVSVLTR